MSFLVLHSIHADRYNFKELKNACFVKKCYLSYGDNTKISSRSPQVWSGHKNCWTMRQYLTTGWRCTPLTAVWSRCLPSWRSTSRFRMSMIMPHRPPNLSIIHPSWRTHPKTSQSSRSRRLTRTRSPVKNCPIRSLAGTPRASSSSTLRLVSVSKSFVFYLTAGLD